MRAHMLNGLGEVGKELVDKARHRVHHGDAEVHGWRKLQHIELPAHFLHVKIQFQENHIIKGFARTSTSGSTRAKMSISSDSQATTVTAGSATSWTPLIFLIPVMEIESRHKKK